MIAMPLANSICVIRSSSSVELQASSTHSMNDRPVQSSTMHSNFSNKSSVKFHASAAASSVHSQAADMPSIIAFHPVTNSSPVHSPISSMPSINSSGMSTKTSPTITQKSTKSSSNHSTMSSVKKSSI